MSKAGLDEETLKNIQNHLIEQIPMKKMGTRLKRLPNWLPICQMIRFQAMSPELKL